MFDYDGVFEDLQAKKEKPKAAEPAARRSRYIESLMDKAKDRQREQDIVYEKRCCLRETISGLLQMLQVNMPMWKGQKMQIHVQ